MHRKLISITLAYYLQWYLVQILRGEYSGSTKWPEISWAWKSNLQNICHMIKWPFLKTQSRCMNCLHVICTLTRIRSVEYSFSYSNSCINYLEYSEIIIKIILNLKSKIHMSWRTVRPSSVSPEHRWEKEKEGSLMFCYISLDPGPSFLFVRYSEETRPLSDQCSSDRRF